MRFHHLFLFVGLALFLSAPSWAQSEDGGPPPEDGADPPAAEDTSTEPSGDGSAPVEAAGADRRKRAEEAEASTSRELRSAEEQVNDLKERVFRTKAKLLLLEEKVIRGIVSGARAVVYHQNDMGKGYAVESLVYTFDGTPIFEKSGGASGTRNQEVKIFEGNVPPGNHVLTVTAVLRGNGSGLFSYINNYQFQLSSSYSFVADDGKTSHIRGRLFEKGGMLAAFTERPSLSFDLKTERTALRSETAEGTGQE